MSASRTLLRKNDKQMFLRRKRLGKKVKPGTKRLHLLDVSKTFVEPFPGKACLLTWADVGQDAAYHATKGYRFNRADAAQ